MSKSEDIAILQNVEIALAHVEEVLNDVVISLDNINHIEDLETYKSFVRVASECILNNALYLREQYNTVAKITNKELLK